MSNPTRTLRALLPTEVSTLSSEETGGSDRVIRFIASTPNVARDGGIVEVQGWQTDDYMRAHPVFLWSHQPDQPPLGKATRIEKRRDGLIIDIEFAGLEQNYPFADRIFRLYKFGALRAVSVGFRVLEERAPTEEESQRGVRWVAVKTELLELSAVAVPADPGAIAKGAFSQDEFTSLKTQFGAVQGWEPVLRSIETCLEAALVEPPAPPSPIPAPRTTASSTSARTDCPARLALMEELRDLMTRANECVMELAAMEAEGPSETTTGMSGHSASQEAATTRAVAEVGETPSASADDRMRKLLDLLDRTYPCQI